jgi:TRAP-type C4-dicarboxylate transport system permease small subunit
LKLVNNLSDIVFKIEKVFVIILVGLMFTSLTAGVLFRYFLKMPLHWADETAIFSLVWLTFIGGSMSIKHGHLAAVTIFVDRLPGRLRHILLCISTTLVLGFGILLLVVSIEWVLQPTIAFQKSPIMEVPMIYPYLSVPIGMLFLCIHSLNLVVKTLTGTNQTENLTETDRATNSLADEVV